MIQVSNADIERIIRCMDIAIAHYKSKKGLRNITNAWVITNIKEKLIRKINKQQLKNQTEP